MNIKKEGKCRQESLEEKTNGREVVGRQKLIGKIKRRKYTIGKKSEGKY